MGLIALSDLLTAPSYRLKLIATLFGVPEYSVEDQFGPQRVQTTVLLAAVSNYFAGGYGMANSARVTTDTQAAFLLALRPNEDFGLKDSNNVWQAGQSADGYSAAQIASLQAELAS